MHSPPLLQPLLWFASYLSAARAFSVTVGSESPTQCGPLTVTWTGGQAPFEIILTPVFNVPRTELVPSTAFNNNQGSYQIPQLPLANGTRFLLTMSDATGFGTGGTTNLLTVAPQVGGASCDTSAPTLAFDFSLPSSLQQCSPYVFDSYSGATLPVTITGFIPGGDSFLLHPDPTATSYAWTANIAAGTSVIFSLTDAQGRSGGSSDIEQVARSNDASCLGASSPSSTGSAAPWSTSASTTTTNPTPSQTQTSSSGVSVAAIAGTAAGVLIAVAASVTLVLFCIKRRRYGRSPHGVPPTRMSRRVNSMDLDAGPADFQHAAIYPFPYQTDSVARLAPPIGPGSVTPSSSFPETSSVHASAPAVHPDTYSFPPSDTRQQHSRATSNTESFWGFGETTNSSSMSSSGRRKAAMAGMANPQAPARFIVHTDAADVIPANDAEVVELPPQYSERLRSAAPLVQQRPMSTATQYASTDIAYAPGSYVDEPSRTTPYPPPSR
ncbi:hypothetical protein PAXRUDRAFT_831835 [Paxillus rubicundulus Ve08.2h10]|uniref:Uncharacterized protein n=1 Tax=Paxillus rubicundulus Ve08.2h10 TaxID=930991 RepID=A0A0D0DMY6_9AGAM|nr:hypothetical protein PAXRUDRAFT_831835 [Paxillus rubicundulus Ve08.2h10]